jgi:hypothetical protein
LRQGAIGALLNTLTTSSTITLATLYLQNTRGLAPLAAAATLLPFSLAVIVGSALAAPILARWPPQWVIAGGLGAVAICDAALISSAADASAARSTTMNEPAGRVPPRARRRRRSMTVASCDASRVRRLLEAWVEEPEAAHSRSTATVASLGGATLLLNGRSPRWLSRPRRLLNRRADAAVSRPRSGRW